MEGKEKKYLIKESELREIIREMLLMELYNPNDFKALYSSNWDGKPIQVKNVLNTAKGVISSFPEIFAPGSTERVMAGNNPILRGIYQALGATGTAAAPNWLPDVLKGQKIGAGSNAGAEQPLDVASACRWLRANSGAKSISRCAEYVRRALNTGGLDLPHGMFPAGAATDYYNILKNNGWQEIPASIAGEPCDVCVITKHPGHPFGHIAMCIGHGQWASDFKQRTMHGLKQAPPPACVHVFRYRNRR